MEFTISQQALKRELEYVQSVVEKKSTIPVLSNILIESVGDNKIRLVGTDLDLTMVCETEAEIKKGGTICIPARKLFDIVRLLGNDALHFKEDGNGWVALKSGKSKFRLAGVGADQYVEVPQIRSTPFNISAKLLKFFIQHTQYAITMESSRFTLSGAKFEIGQDSVRMVATDGHRLALVEKKGEAFANSEKMDALIPKKALAELLKLSATAVGDVKFGEDNNHLFFEVDGRMLTTRKLSGSFPNYEMAIPKSCDKTVKFNAEAMKQAVRRVALMADERQSSIRFLIKPNEVEISAISAEEGEATEIIEADYQGKETALAFNWKYLVDALQVDVFETETEVKEEVATDLLCLEFKDNNSQVKFHPEANEYLSVLMPVRL